MKKILYFLLLIPIAFLVFYMYMPVVAYGFASFPVLLLALVSLNLFFNKVITITPIKTTVANNKKSQPTYTGGKLKFVKRIPVISISFIVLIGLYLTVWQAITTWSLNHHQEYRNLIGDVEIGDNFSKHLTPISIENIRVVDESLANLLGDKVLGAQPALGSQVNLGKFNIQKVNNSLYWVAPLEHSGFFKWNKNKKGTNGYVMVNATNERDVKLVQSANGFGVFIKYQPESYFFDNLERHLYFKGYFSTPLTDYTFEIDDTGVPFWVVTKYERTVGFDGDNAVGVVVVNAENGSIQEFSIDDAPEWIDRIQPEHFIKTQLNDWGQYVKGYWNFSNEEKLQITEDLTLVYGEDNRSYWYTGLTSVGADESTVGFVLVDTRTKEAVWYKQSGATEFAAQNSAIGKVQEKGYYASLPIPYNINNNPTYIMTLKDNGGLVKMYAMVSIKDYTIVGVGNSLQETLMAYKNAFNMTGNSLNENSLTNKASLVSVVTRISSDIKNGNSFYYLMLKVSDKIFIGSTQISNDLPVTLVGDSVEISFDDEKDNIIGLSSFKNKSLKK